MSTPILATKLSVPPSRPNAVLRSRLIERLDEGLQGRLILVSAPAGFGKTTMISEWAAGCRRLEPEVRPAWLSLDEGDSDPARFMTYLVAALQTVAADVGEGALGMLQSPQPPPTEAVLTALLNEITTLPHGVVLVLDDYHVVDSEPVDHALAFLLEHLPPQMHLVIATREDPHLPLARWRARGQLTELRAADLRFTPSEAAEFLNRVMSLDLSAEDITALETRTEGWIAGLQLAALSIQGRSDAAGFIRTFAGSHRFVLDYLVEEVLQRQPERARSFLLQTAILDTLCGALCDAVTGQKHGKGTLERLERDNLFVVPLDEERRWYRYHHLFADVLQAYLLEEQPDHLPALHRRASEWYEENGSRSDAIRHALCAKDFGWAADLIELAAPMTEDTSQAATWLKWASALPDELIRSRPVLGVWFAWALMGSGELETAEAWLREAERWLKPGTSEPNGVVDEDQLRSLLATIEVARAYNAHSVGDVPGTVKHAQRVLELLPEGDHVRRQQATALIGLTYWASGDLEAADRVFVDYSARLLAAGNIPDAISAMTVLP
ncbi:MAG: AAA family ATPase, partial [Actinomycetes bacterium]